MTEYNWEQLKQFRKELKKLIESEKLPKGYDAEEIVLYCLFYNNGFEPTKKLDDPESYLLSVYFLRESDVPADFVKHWSVWHAEVQDAFKKIESNGLLIKILKRYGFLNP